MSDLTFLKVFDAVAETEMEHKYDGAVMVFIARRYNYTNSAPAFPSISRIVKETQLGKTSVSQSIARLQANGWLRVVDRSKQMLSNLYYVMIPADRKLIDFKADSRVERTLESNGEQTDSDDDFTSSEVAPHSRSELGPTRRANGERGMVNGEQKQVKECLGADAPKPLRFAPESFSRKKFIPNVPANFESWAANGGADVNEIIQIWSTHYCEHVPEGADPFGKASMAKLYATASRMLGIAA
jgi:hypothetical protein